MQHTATDSPSPTSASFAGLLAALTAPTPRTAWNNDDLADDVATLSYEHALRANARCKTPDADEWGMNSDDGAEPVMPSVVSQEDAAVLAGVVSKLDASEKADSSALKSVDSVATTLERNKKCASITIRLSSTECDQLRRRAAQAGLTVSAYLRSCTFEAETLRAQVKDVLAELRTATSVQKESSQVAIHRPRFGWLTRLMPRRHFAQRVARA